MIPNKNDAVLVLDDFNSFFQECGELLNITIPYRFYEIANIQPYKMQKNFQAVIKGLRKRLKKEKENKMADLSKLTKGAQAALGLLLDYLNQIVDVAKTYETVINQQAEKIQELESSDQKEVVIETNEN